MLSNRIYYSLKPYLPWRIRMGIRRFRARKVRAANQATWPIDPGSLQPPRDWTGWPERKQFAFVLTHDVESAEGLEKVRQLAELEMSLGFRSSFNFIPEGEYVVPASLRAWLITNGFEVGVHDLHHDGKLYRSRQEFRERAQRINRYLKEWGAVGYRSGFMLRNLEWHQDLNIGYDASTFDTDPFEPQPDGAGTIFPFWVPALSALGRPGASVQPLGRGYLELPYTLPQDSTLFLLLGERSPEIWQRKLAWLARQGGMALLNTHPDYMNFGTDSNPRCFPVEYYEKFLRSVVENYRDRIWRVLPKDLTGWYTSWLATRRNSLAALGAQTATAPAAPLVGKRAAVLLYSYYPADPRPRRAAEALAEAGMAVDLICLREGPDEPKRESINGVSVRRLPMGKTRAGKVAYFWQYGRFIASCFFVLAWRCLRRRYDFVHVHNMPDILAFAAAPAKLQGARVILDQHDPMPELMTSIYGLAPQHWLVRLLKVMERWSFAYVDRVVTVNLACRKIFSSRSCAAEKIAVVMNSPDDSIFEFRPPQPAAQPASRFVIMYHGSIVERHGLDLAVEALRAVRASHPRAELRIYGKTNPFLSKVLKQAADSGLSEAVHHLGSVDHAGIARAIDECDLGIIPNRRSIFTEINTPTRIFEYLARGKPVVAPRAPGITDYFGPDELNYFELGDVGDLTRQILHVAEHPAEALRTVERGQRVYFQHRWSSERRDFVRLVTGLVADEKSPVGEPVAVGP